MYKSPSLNALNSATSFEQRQEKQAEINAIVRNFIKTHGDRYAILKKELLELGVETLSDVHQLDEHYKQKIWRLIMKIRIAITSPRMCFENNPFAWSVATIDEFIGRFVYENTLTIGQSNTVRWDCFKDNMPENVGIRMPISNFQKHSEHVATFNTEFPQTDVICILFALNVVDSPDGSGMVHNVRVDAVEDDFDPLQNPKAKSFQI